MAHIDRNGSRIHYVVEGQGPPVLLHHGFADALQCWEEQGWVRRLASRFRVIRLDALGHGRSSKPHDSDAYAMSERVADVVAVMDAAGVGSAHYVGYSLGGRVGFELAAAVPERVRSLALGGAHPFAQSMAPFRQAISCGMAGLVALLESLDGPLPSPLRERLLGNDPVALATSLAQDRPDRSSWMARIRVPTLLFAGSDDTLRPEIERAAMEQPGSHLLQITGFDHMTLALHLVEALPAVHTFLRCSSERPISQLDERMTTFGIRRPR
jgi:pimeloyl-ACP methyl ester carboxylesterase